MHSQPVTHSNHAIYSQQGKRHVYTACKTRVEQFHGGPGFLGLKSETFAAFWHRLPTNDAIKDLEPLSACPNLASAPTTPG